MKDLLIEGTQQLPNLSFSASTGEFRISGQSIPENAVEIYDPILSWVDEYAVSPCDKTTLEFKMKYYNTASSKMLFNLVKKLNTIFKSGADVEIQWHYQEDDEDMLDAGEYFKDLVEIPFKFETYP